MKVGVTIQDHKELLSMFVMKLGHYAIVLGISRLRPHDVAVWFASNTVTFGSQCCTTHSHDTPVTVQEVKEDPLEPAYVEKESLFELQIWVQRPFWSILVMLNGPSHFCTFKKGRLMVYTSSLYEINQAIEPQDLEEWPFEESSPEQYNEFLPPFTKVVADHLPPHQPGINYQVWFKQGKKLTSWPLYSMLRKQLVVLREWLEDNMGKGFTCQLLPQFAVPVVFVKMPDGGQQLWIGYPDCNCKTIKVRYLLNMLRRARVYTKSNSCRAYNLLWLEEGTNIGLSCKQRMNCSNVQLCISEQSLLQQISKNISIMPVRKLWMILHLPIWMMWWYTVILRRNMWIMLCELYKVFGSWAIFKTGKVLIP